MSLSLLLSRIRPAVLANRTGPAAPWPTCTLFLSMCDSLERARVLHVSGNDFETLWRELAESAQRQVQRDKFEVRWLRVDWVVGVRSTTWRSLKASLKAVKRNYFRYGLALDPAFGVAFLEAEINANAMLYGGNHVEHAMLNEKNFRIYAQTRFKGSVPDFNDERELWVLSTQGVFCSLDEPCQPLYRSGPDAGRRIIDRLDIPTVTRLIADSSTYLRTQVKEDGRFRYGWHPCFDRPINTYNTLRHASTVYAMLEAWEVTRDPALEEAILRALRFLTTQLIRTMALPGGVNAAFLLDVGNEMKLGGNAVCVLALVKYTELFGDDTYRPLLEQLGQGMAYMQNAQTGGFVHVLNYPDLRVKDVFRVIYYDGEAAFALMRLYGLTRDQRWLDVVEKAFDYFIEREHWRTHDHWLGYCVNELTLYRPLERYYQFGVRNVADHLNFVSTRITTFPTLLELMMASETLLERLRGEPALTHLLDGFDMREFHQALDFRAHHLLNGHFWPELAMYFRNPRRILGSFFIRHHAFRVRIDDVEHYLSGFVAYRRFLVRQAAEQAASSPSAVNSRS